MTMTTKILEAFYTLAIALTAGLVAWIILP
jgi:hypothetical protein